MTTPHEAWTLRRLLVGHALNGELQALSERYRGVAERMAGLPSGDRPAAWEGFLGGCPDRDGIINALAAVDPTGPPPEDDGTDGDWPPLRFTGLPGVEPFPVAVLPEPAARLVIEGAKAIGCQPDFLGVPVLAIAGGAIGRSVSLLLKQGYFAGSTVFAGCVGPPSDGKTPALKVAADAIRRIDADLEAEHAQAVVLWREEADRPGPDGKKAKPPPPPKPRRIDVDDITMEAVPLILADNPRGLVMIRDELNSFLSGMNQFKSGGKGNDRSNTLKIWSGDAIKKDRVAHEANVPIRCPHPTLSIVGGLTPGMLGELLDPKGRADGFIDRFLLTYPDILPVPPWTERGVPEAVADDWRAVVARLWARPMNVHEGRSVPHVARFSPEGKASWQGHYDAHALEMNGDDFPPHLRGPWGKFREYAGRLALILACMHHATDPTSNELAVPCVGPRDVLGAWRLIDYFKSHARRVHGAIALGPGIGGGPVVKAVVDWLTSGDRLSFSERDIKQSRRWFDSADLADALKFLASRHAIRPRPAPPDHPKGGRPPSPAYEVNPALLVTQNTQNPRNPDRERNGDPEPEGFEGSEGFE